MAAELIGKVKTIPIITETKTPAMKGRCSVAQIMAFPTEVAAEPIAGAHHIAKLVPTIKVTKGVTIISTLVVFETSLPISVAINAIMKTAKGPPAPANSFVARPTPVNENKTRGGAFKE